MTEPNSPIAEVLIVDDDALVTRTLSYLLASDGSLVAELFNDPHKALDFLKTRRVDVVVADFLMPGMDGIQFLLKVRELWPTTSRIMLTGYADKDAAIRAINEVGLYHFIEKPWRNEELLLLLRNAAERSRLLEELERRTQDIVQFREKLFRALL